MRWHKKVKMGENIFLFIPNIIGYVRVITLLVACYCMTWEPVVAAISYIISGLLDAFDGWAARTFNQGTSFGAVLDMVTDRVSTTLLIMALCYFYPQYIFLLQLVVALDIASHWLQMYTSLLHGDSSHKVTDLSANPIMRFYYMRPVLFTFCACNELFFASLYILYFTEGPTFSVFGVSLGFFKILAWLVFPISFLKQVVSVIQMVVAAKNIAGMDEVERSQRREQRT